MTIPPSTLTQILNRTSHDGAQQSRLNQDVDSITSGTIAREYSGSLQSQRLVEEEARQTKSHATINTSTLRDLKLRDTESAIKILIDLATSLRADTIGANSDTKQDNSAYPRISSDVLSAMLNTLNTQHNGMNVLGGTELLGPVVKGPQFHELTGQRIIPGADDPARDAEAFTGTGLLKLRVWDQAGHQERTSVTVNLSNPPSGITNMGELRTAIRDQMQAAGVAGFDVGYTPTGALSLSTGDPNLGLILGTGTPGITVSGTTAADDTDPYAGPDPVTVTILDQESGEVLHRIDVDTSAVTDLGELRAALEAAVQPVLPTFNTGYGSGNELLFNTGDATKTLLVGSNTAQPMETTTGLDFEGYFELNKIDYYMGNTDGNPINANTPGVEKILRAAMMASYAPQVGNPDNDWLGNIADLLQQGIDEVSDGIYTEVLNEQNINLRAKNAAEFDNEASREVIDDIKATNLYKKLTDVTNSRVHLEASRLTSLKLSEMTRDYIRSIAAAA